MRVLQKNFTFREAEHIVPRQAVYRVSTYRAEGISRDLRRGQYLCGGHVFCAFIRYLSYYLQAVQADTKAHLFSFEASKIFQESQTQ